MNIHDCTEGFKALATCGLMARDEYLESFIGKVVKYKNWEPSMGTFKRDFNFRIIGVQKNWRGDIIWRGVRIDDVHIDTFGLPIDPSEVEFV